MAGPIALAAMIARMRKLRCPHCGHEKLVDRQPKQFRVCPRCKKHFPDPVRKRR